VAGLLPVNAGDSSTGFVLSGIDIDDYAGSSVSAAADVNGDGIGDLIIGAYKADPTGATVPARATSSSADPLLPNGRDCRELFLVHAPRKLRSHHPRLRWRAERTFLHGRPLRVHRAGGASTISRWATSTSTRPTTPYCRDTSRALCATIGPLLYKSWAR